MSPKKSGKRKRGEEVKKESFPDYSHDMPDYDFPDGEYPDFPHKKHPYEEFPPDYSPEFPPESCPTFPPGVCPPGTILHYKIMAGDTFFKLAKRFGTTVEAIMAANPGVDPKNLQIGQIVHIPCGIPDAKG